ncbi:MAG: tetratricopeptide repeat protein [Thermoanaerobaculia bacterium]
MPKKTSTLRCRVRLVAAALILAWASSRVAADPSLLEAARDALAEDRAADAELLYRRALDAEPDLISAYRGLAEALAAQERRPEAVAVLLRVGEGLIRAGVHGRALEVLRRALELAPRSAAVHGLLGRALSLDRRYVEAAGHLGLAVELGTADLRTLLYLGAAQWENGRVEEAEAVYRQAAAIAGASFLPFHQLGRLLSWQGRTVEAVAVLQVAAEMTNAVDVELDFARALQKVGETEKALAAFQRVVALAPDRSHGRYGLAQVLARTGDVDGAREQLEIYRRLYDREQQRVREQELAKARLGRGWELLRQGGTREAIAHFESLPAAPDALLGLAAAHTAAGNPGAAVDLLERAVALAPERGDLRLRLAEARLEASQ